MPAPQTRRTFASFGSGRAQVARSTRGATAAAMRRAFSTASRVAPVTIRSGRRSPMPSTSHHAFAATVDSTAGPLRRSRKCWSSSICPSANGWIDTTAGPPVENANDVTPATAPSSGFHSGRNAMVQRAPGPRSCLKS